MLIAECRMRSGGLARRSLGEGGAMVEGPSPFFMWAEAGSASVDGGILLPVPSGVRRQPTRAPTCVLALAEFVDVGISEHTAKVCDASRHGADRFSNRFTPFLRQS